MKRFIAALALVLLPILAVAAEYKANPADWSAEDAEDIRTKSPWVVTQELFPAALRANDDPMSKPNGSVLRVPVQIAWYGSAIYRHAYVKQFQNPSPALVEEMTAPQDRFYLILVTTKDTLSIFNTPSDEELRKATSLEVDGKSYPLSFIQRPKDRKNPEALFAFEKGDGIPADAKQAVFVTKAGDASFKAKFKLEKMKWQGKRDLDGDIMELSENEKTRRAVQAAVLGKEADLAKAVVSVKVEKLEDKERPWAAYIVYDPAREPAEPKPDALTRKLGITSRLGEWSLANGTDLQAIVFLDPATNSAQEFVLAKDAEKIAKMAPEGAAAEFKKKVQKPGAEDAEEKPATKKQPKKKPGT